MTEDNEKRERKLYLDYYVFKGYLKLVIKDGKRCLTKGPYFSKMRDDNVDFDDVVKFGETNQGLKIKVDED